MEQEITEEKNKNFLLKCPFFPYSLHVFTDNAFSVNLQGACFLIDSASWEIICSEFECHPSIAFIVMPAYVIRISLLWVWLFTEVPARIQDQITTRDGVFRDIHSHPYLSFSKQNSTLPQTFCLGVRFSPTPLFIWQKQKYAGTKKIVYKDTKSRGKDNENCSVKLHFFLHRFFKMTRNKSKTIHWMKSRNCDLIESK